MKKLHKLGITIGCTIPAAAGLGVAVGTIAKTAIDRKMVDLLSEEGYIPKEEAAEEAYVKEMYDRGGVHALTRYYFTGTYAKRRPAGKVVDDAPTINPYKVIKDDIYTYLGFWTQTAAFYLYLQKQYPEIFQDLGGIGDILTASGNANSLEINYDYEYNVARLSGQVRLDTEFTLTDENDPTKEIGKCHVYLSYTLKDMPYSIILGQNGLYASWINGSSLQGDKYWKLSLTLNVHTEYKDQPEVPDVNKSVSYDYNDGAWEQAETKTFCWTSYHLNGKMK